ncbi:MAG: SLC13 family permease [Pigmentiphaga sp.]
MDATITLFILVYIAMGVGHLPGFKVDRTGAALLGAMLLIVIGSISPKDAWAAIDVNTIGLLFGLMVVSAAFTVAGFYDWAAQRVAELKVGPSLLLAILIVVSGVLSALLTNDVMVVAMTPVLCAITLSRRLNPIPFLLGFGFAANTGSVATMIGSPKNMIIAEALQISFNDFSRMTLLPAVVGMALTWLTLAVLYRGRWQLPAAPPAAGAPLAPAVATPWNRVETLKAAIITLALIAAFIFTDWPHMVIALAAASVLLINRKIASGKLLEHVDGNLLLLLMGLFVVNAAMAATGLPNEVLNALRNAGIDLHSPVSMLLISAVISDLVGNNPTAMLLTPFLAGAENAQLLGAAIVLGTSFSSNAIVFGSLAGIIVVEQASAHGVTISFMEFLRAGLPVTLVTLMLAIAWLYFLGA